MSAALAALREQLRDHGVEATAWPFFVIVEKKHHKIVLLAGVWFSRDAAEKALKASRHNFPGAFVYCASGHLSNDWRELISEVRDGEG